MILGCISCLQIFKELFSGKGMEHIIIKVSRKEREIGIQFKTNWQTNMVTDKYG